jgi:hypothetical protein
LILLDLAKALEDAIISKEVQTGWTLWPLQLGRLMVEAFQSSNGKS